MKHWEFSPFFLHLHHFQSVEQFFLPLEICFESVAEQRLAKSARTSKKHIAIPVGKVEHQVGLINI